MNQAQKLKDVRMCWGHGGRRVLWQLDMLLQKILPKIRDRVKRRIMPMLVRRKHWGIYVTDSYLKHMFHCMK
jgi:hypothetical protein